MGGNANENGLFPSVGLMPPQGGIIAAVLVIDIPIMFSFNASME